MKIYKKRGQSYPSDLTDAQWMEIEPLFSGMRQYTWPKRELTDAVLYFVKTGCQWRQLPHDFPPYSTVHSFYRRARESGLWDRILQHLVIKTREDAGRSPEPTYGIIDSQSVKTVAASEERGIDGGKKRRAGNGTLS
jgi:transposase